jgi:hypothetical protein
MDKYVACLWDEHDNCFKLLFARPDDRALIVKLSSSDAVKLMLQCREELKTK